MAQDCKVFLDLEAVPDEDFLVVGPDGCDCGTYRFYSTACSHVYATVNIECAKVTWTKKYPAYCDTVGKSYDITNWKAIGPCSGCVKREVILSGREPVGRLTK